jgi:hypothetical protein
MFPFNGNTRRCEPIQPIQPAGWNAPLGEHLPAKSNQQAA